MNTSHTPPQPSATRPGNGSLAIHVVWIFILGIMAGFFGTYSANINLATATLDGPTYALIQSSFNRNVRHFLFFVFFFGTAPAGLVLLAVSWAERHRRWWKASVVLTLAYTLGIIVFTRQVNLPLNYLTESWTPATVPANWAEIRDAWNAANLWRAGLNAVLFALGLWTLIDRLTPRQSAHAAVPQSVA